MRWVAALVLLPFLAFVGPGRPVSAEEAAALPVAHPYWSHDFEDEVLSATSADLDGDGWEEIGIHVRGSTWYWLDQAGRVLWQKPLPAARQVQVRPVDLDGDGLQELVLVVEVATIFADEGVVLALDGDGRERWRRPLPGRPGALAVRRDGNGSPTILVALENPVPGSTYALDGAGEIQWIHRGGTVSTIHPLPPGRDGDGAWLVGVGRHLGAGQVRLKLLDDEGRTRWSSELEVGDLRRAEPELRLVQLDGDEPEEILVLVRGWDHRAGGLLCRIESDGRQTWCRPVESSVRRLEVLPQGDGVSPVVVVDPPLRGFRGEDGAALETVPGSAVREVVQAHGLGYRLHRTDLDGDGRQEGLFRWGSRLSLAGLPPEGDLPVRDRPLWSVPPVPGIRHSLHRMGGGATFSVLLQARHLGAGLEERPSLRLLTSWGGTVWQTRIGESVHDAWLASVTELGERGPWLPEVFVLTTPRLPSTLPGLPPHVPSGRLLALDRDDGTVRWELHPEEPVTACGGLAEADGTVVRVAVGTAGTETGPAAVLLFDGDGDRVARVSTPGPVHHLAGAGRTLYVGGEAAGGGGFLLALDPAGRTTWRRSLAAVPRVVAVGGTAGRSLVVVGNSLFDGSGKRLRDVPVVAMPHFAAVGDVDGDGRPEAVILTFDRTNPVQAYVLGDDGGLLDAWPVEGNVTALAVGSSPSGPIRVGISTPDGAHRVETLDRHGQLLASYPVEEAVEALAAVADPEGFRYVSVSGHAARVAAVYRPPPLMAAPRFDVRADEYRVGVHPTGTPVAVRLQVRRGLQRRWTDLGEGTTGAEAPEELRWPVQPFGVADLGRTVRFRLVYREVGPEAVWEGTTSPVLAARKLPIRWRFLQEAVLGALLATALLAAPGSIYLYRRWRQRRRDFRDLLVRLRQPDDGTGPSVELVPQGKRPRRLVLDEEGLGRLQAEAGGLERAARDGREVLGFRALALREMMLRLLGGDEVQRHLYERGDPVRLRLDVTGGSVPIQELPWELLTLSQDPQKRLLRPGLSLLRFLPTGPPRRRPVVPDPLRMLVVHPRCSGDPPLDHQAELAGLERLAANPRTGGRVDLRTLGGREATLKRLAAALEEPWDVLHVLGHGTVVEPGLRLVDHRGDPHRIDPARLRELLQRPADGRRSPFLLFLNVCGSPSSARLLADSLVVPGRLAALVVSGTETGDRASVLFAERFYSALLDSGQIDHAAERGRQALVQLLAGESMLGTLEWAAPRVYTRVEDGHLYDRL